MFLAVADLGFKSWLTTYLKPWEIFLIPANGNNTYLRGCSKSSGTQSECGTQRGSRQPGSAPGMVMTRSPARGQQAPPCPSRRASRLPCARRVCALGRDGTWSFVRLVNRAFLLRAVGVSLLYTWSALFILKPFYCGRRYITKICRSAIVSVQLSGTKHVQRRAPTSVQPQNCSIFPNRNSTHKSATPDSLVPPAPSNHHSTFRLNELHSSKYITEVES